MAQEVSTILAALIATVARVTQAAAPAQWRDEVGGICRSLHLQRFALWSQRCTAAVYQEQDATLKDPSRRVGHWTDRPAGRAVAITDSTLPATVTLTATDGAAVHGLRSQKSSPRHGGLTAPISIAALPASYSRDPFSRRQSRSAADSRTSQPRQPLNRPALHQSRRGLQAVWQCHKQLTSHRRPPGETRGCTAMVRLPA